VYNNVTTVRDRGKRSNRSAGSYGILVGIARLVYRIGISGNLSRVYLAACNITAVGRDVRRTNYLPAIDQPAEQSAFHQSLDSRILIIIYIYIIYHMIRAFLAPPLPTIRSHSRGHKTNAYTIRTHPRFSCIYI